MSARVEFRILGPLEVLVDGARVPLGGAKQQAVLGALLTEAGRVVSAERLVELLWGDDAGDRAPSTLQVHVSNLRRALAPASEALGGRELIETRRPGYCAVVETDELDLTRFDRLVTDAREAAEQSPARALEQYRLALALWRGEPLAGLESSFAMVNPATRLVRQHTAAIEQRLGLELELGHATEVLGELTGLVEQNPLNERLRGLLMLALYQCGRQAEALDCYQQGREVLAEQLGLSPSPELRDLESRILDQDPALTPTPGGRPGGDLVDDLGTVLRSSVLRTRAFLLVGDQRYQLDQPVITLGRRADRDIVLDDVRASRAHAEVRMRGADFVLVDTGSSNGTLVDDERIFEYVLGHGDVFRIGDTVIRFELGV